MRLLMVADFGISACTAILPITETDPSDAGNPAEYYTLEYRTADNWGSNIGKTQFNCAECGNTVLVHRVHLAARVQGAANGSVEDDLVCSPLGTGARMEGDRFIDTLHNVYVSVIHTESTYAEVVLSNQPLPPLLHHRRVTASQSIHARWRPPLPFHQIRIPHATRTYCRSSRDTTGWTLTYKLGGAPRVGVADLQSLPRDADRPGRPPWSSRGSGSQLPEACRFAARGRPRCAHGAARAVVTWIRAGCVSPAALRASAAARACIACPTRRASLGTQSPRFGAMCRRAQRDGPACSAPTARP